MLCNLLFQQLRGTKSQCPESDWIRRLCSSLRGSPAPPPCSHSSWAPTTVVDNVNRGSWLALERLQTQQQRPELVTELSPGVQVNVRHINSTRGTSITFSYGHSRDMRNSIVEILNVRVQLPETQVTLHLHVWQAVQEVYVCVCVCVWGGGVRRGNRCTCCLLTQHQLNQTTKNNNTKLTLWVKASVKRLPFW